jgi:YD repeat-containing protein
VRADYLYDALERPALRTTQNMTPSGTTHYVYDRAGRLLVEAGPTGATVREYVWLAKSGLRISRIGGQIGSGTTRMSAIAQA